MVHKTTTLVLRSTKQTSGRNTSCNLVTSFKSVHDVIEYIGNSYIDNEFQFDDEEFLHLWNDHVQWVKVTNSGPMGIETTNETYHQLEIYLQKIGMKHKRAFNSQYNPIAVVKVQNSLFSSGGKGLFAATSIKKDTYISFYVGKVKSFEQCRQESAKKENPYLLHLQGQNNKVLDPILPQQNKFYNSYFLAAHYINDKSFDNDDGRVRFNAIFEGIFVKSISAIRKGSEIYIKYDKFQLT